MPLIDVSEATLAQMASTQLTTEREIIALEAWCEDVVACSYPLINAGLRRVPVYVPIALSGWNDDDKVFARLMKRKIGWGDAVMQLKANRAALLSKIADQTSRLLAESNRSREVELSRRATLLNTFVGLIP